jgi:hypothetical protein
MLLAKRIANRLGRPFGINPFPRAFPNQLADEAPATEVFDLIHQQNFWGSSESASGLGSECAYAKRYRNRLHILLKERGLLRIFDAPCGDLNWITPIIDDPDLDYLGGDVSTRVVQVAAMKRPGVRVQAFDITADMFPDADVWHCRDCLFHLPFHDIRRALVNFGTSNVPYAILTSHNARFFHRNLDVNLGGFRYLDLHRPPIGLPRATVYLRDHRPGFDFPRYVGLWSRDTIVDALRRWAG